MKPSPARPGRSNRGTPRAGVLVFGEVLCDLFAAAPGIPLATAEHLVPHLGGAPANVAVQLARLGVPTRLLTATGNDPFGARLKQTLAAEGVDTSAMILKADRRTGCTLVEVDTDGERHFYGFRENSADLALGVADLQAAGSVAALRGVILVHTGTVGLRSPATRQATRELQLRARAAGAIVSIDVNLRPGMFPSVPLLLRLALAALARADVVKATRDEARQLADAAGAPLRHRRGHAADDELATWLLSRGPRLALLTFAEDGCIVATARRRVRRQPRRRILRPVDVTGAGDAFVGGALAWLCQHVTEHPDFELHELEENHMMELGDRAGLCGAAAVTALGATTRMLSRAELDAGMEQ